jgi:uncharacterized membrane protein YgcG
LQIKYILYLFFLLSFSCLLLAEAPAVQAEERITDFSSRVEVLSSGILSVTETITVTAEGNQIRHGIFRDFPTHYTDQNGLKRQVGFSVVSVKCDDRQEPYHTERITGGIRVYIGSPDYTVPEGTHSYTLQYTTSRQIGFFPDHDELYWNVTGNFWIFPIEHTRVTIIIPEPGIIENFDLFTGRSGMKEKNGRLVARTDNSITLETTAYLRPGYGFTVVVGWQKGIITPVTGLQKWIWFCQNNLTLIGGSLGLLLLLLYYTIRWVQIGRDPEAGTIIPLYTPPKDISPAAGRYIMRMGFDQQTFAAVLINMAVKGVIRIEQGDDKSSEYTLHLLHTGVEKLTRAELAVRKKLFKNNKSIVLEQKNRVSIQAAISVLKKWLRTDLVNIYFKQNRRSLIPGIIITLAIIAAVVLGADAIQDAAFITLWLTVWTAAVVVLFLQALKKWQIKQLAGSRLKAVLAALGSTMFFLVFMGGWCMGAFFFITSVSLPGMVILVTALLINAIFAYLLKAPTLSGRKIMDQLEGLRLYLSVAEKERLNLINPPEKTPELFEKMLPWALALDVEQEWCEQFAEIFEQVDGNQAQYRPLWYTSTTAFSSQSFSSAMGSSLTSTLSSASTSPGSSSGFSSGGSSGGGGGGGGW